MQTIKFSLHSLDLTCSWAQCCVIQLRVHARCIVGEDTDEEDAEGGAASGGAQEEEDGDMAAAQNDRRASHAQASTKDADTAMADVTDDAGESSSNPQCPCRPAVFSSWLPRFTNEAC